MSVFLSPRRELGEFKKRYKWMALVVVISFLVLFLRLVQLQLVEYDRWNTIAWDNITHTMTIPATRGEIFDSNGEVVATNRPSFDVYLTPGLVQNEGRLERFFELMEYEAPERVRLEDRLESVPQSRRMHQIPMVTNITRDQMAILETHAAELRGVDVIETPSRTYPFRQLGAHAIGYINEVKAEDLDRPGNYRAGDVIGRTGIERALESRLRGQRGFRRRVVDAAGRTMQTEVEALGEMYRPAVAGHNVNLTLDMELMRIIERAFRGHPAGAVAVIEVDTGRVRALYSKPSYDINEMAGRLTHERFAEIRENPFRPLIDKTVYETYFPGSTFKPITAFAAMGDGEIDPATTVNCPGYYELGNRRFRCTAAHGDVNLHEAIVQSCNVYFYRIAHADGMGLERLNDYARRFGFAEPGGIGINSEASGFLATRSWYEETFGRFHTGHTLNAAIGQGNTRATLVQIAGAYAAIANGGILYRPQLIESVVSADGETIESFSPEMRNHVNVEPADLAYVMQGLLGVVNEQEGTAYDARIVGGITIAGKTGTAQVARYVPRNEEDARRAWYFNRSHAWFAGYAPADPGVRPQVAIALLVEHGGGGGTNAAPIATQILQEYLGGGLPEETPEEGEE